MNCPSDETWVNLRNENIFSVFPSILDEVFAEKPHIPQSLQLVVPWVILPSDIDWKTKKYYQLVDKQRQLSAGEELMPTSKRATNQWEMSSRPSSSPRSDKSKRSKRNRRRSSQRDDVDQELAEHLEKVEKHVEQEIKFTEELERDRILQELEDREKARREEELFSFDEESYESDSETANFTQSGVIDISILSLVRPEVSLSLSATSNAHCWPSSDIAKAARLLAVPPMDVEFIDETEMRRVYSLIYDVFRYKNVMNETLTNVRFFTRHGELEKDHVRVWLLLFDLYHRQFSKPNAEITNYRKKLYEDAAILSIDEALWSERIRLAAETSRIRIKNNALHLSQLLPPHLRDERVTSAINNTDKVTCWVNCFRSKCKSDLTECLCKLGMTECVGLECDLDVDEYRFDSLCPKFMVCRPKQKQSVAQSWLVKKHHLVLQDRAFCIGPVIFSMILEHHELGGCVLQSHVNSPRTTAYLANIIHNNNRVLRLLAFGAGEKKLEYDKYFSDLGITNTTIYPQRLIDTSPDADYLEHVVAVFACPPNSYSGVKDPVDLACSRGGDLSVLQALTEADIDEKGRGRVSEILREQRSTLKFAMSRPQIQFVLYETHSALKTENDHMVERVVEEMNCDARNRHLELVKNTSESPEKDNHTSGKDTPAPVTPAPTPTPAHKQEPDSKQEGSKTEPHWSRRPQVEELKNAADLQVPLTDVFHVAEVPDMPEGLSCEQLLKEHGCFLANLQRKEVTKLDHKYMIKMAEARGLFGDDGATSTKNKSSSRQKRREDKLKEAAEAEARRLRKAKKSGGINVERLNTPTHNTNLRNTINKLLRENNMTENCCDLMEAKQCTRSKKNHSHQQRKLQQVSLWRQAVRRIAATKMALIWTRSDAVDLVVSEILHKIGGRLLRTKKWRRKRRVFSVVKNVIEYNTHDFGDKNRHKNCVELIK